MIWYNYRLEWENLLLLWQFVKEAAHFGLNGHNVGDIVYFNEEGFNHIHGDLHLYLSGLLQILLYLQSLWQQA